MEVNGETGLLVNAIGNGGMLQKSYALRNLLTFADETGRAYRAIAKKAWLCLVSGCLFLHLGV